MFEFPQYKVNDVNTLKIIKILFPAKENYSSQEAIQSLDNAWYVSTLGVRELQKKNRELQNNINDLAKKLGIEKVIDDSVEENISYIQFLQRMDEKLLRIYFDKAWAAVSWWDNKGRTKPNYSLWLKKDTWSIEAGILLAYGIDPKDAKLENVIEYAPYSELAGNVKDMWECVQASHTFNTMRIDDAHPCGSKKFIEWCYEKDFEIVPELTAREVSKTDLLARIKLLTDSYNEAHGFCKNYQEKIKLLQDENKQLKKNASAIDTAPKKTDNLNHDKDSLYKIIASLAALYGAAMSSDKAKYIDVNKNNGSHKFIVEKFKSDIHKLLNTALIPKPDSDGLGRTTIRGALNSALEQNPDIAEMCYQAIFPVLSSSAKAEVEKPRK